MTTKARIVVVEDEPEISRFLESALTGQGYDVTAAEAGKVALKLCSAHPPDLVILDLGLPDMDGKDVIRHLREWSRMPILVLSARDQEAEKVAALEAGADDYLTKPFGTAELMARIKVALRHAGRREQVAEQSYTHSGLVIDLARRKVTLKELEIHLTPTEYDLLAVLARKAGQVVTQAELLREVWGRNSEEHDHYLRIYVQRLRQKLSDDPLHPRYIFTEPGIGYRLAEEE
jgi:two-component system, OmpR family, KDP operon response regulator KdpE